MSEPSEAFNAALANEQFGLQAVSSGTIGEASSRAALYFSSLSSGLVAVGFASSSPTLLRALTFTVFPTVFLLGWFTVVRLVDTTAQNIVALQRVEQIRRYWATLDLRGPDFFPVDASSTGARGVRYAARSLLFTTATMVAAVNGVLAGALIAAMANILLGIPLPLAATGGVVIGLTVFTAAVRYQHRRLSQLDSALGS